MTFNFNQFHTLLYNECKIAFPKIIDQLSHENIYAIALYTSGNDWLYLGPTISTKEGLSEVAAQYKKEDYYKDTSIEELEAQLKWSPCDSPHHDTYASLLPETEKLLVKAQFMDELMQEEYYNAFNNKLTTICMDVLKQLDTEDAFSPLDRSSFVLNLLNGDQSDEERLERAKVLNPKNVFIKYKQELVK